MQNSEKWIFFAIGVFAVIILVIALYFAFGGSKSTESLNSIDSVDSLNGNISGDSGIANDDFVDGASSNDNMDSSDNIDSIDDSSDNSDIQVEKIDLPTEDNTPNNSSDNTSDVPSSSGNSSSGNNSDTVESSGSENISQTSASNSNNSGGSSNSSNSSSFFIIFNASKKIGNLDFGQCLYVEGFQNKENCIKNVFSNKGYNNFVDCDDLRKCDFLDNTVNVFVNNQDGFPYKIFAFRYDNNNYFIRLNLGYQKIFFYRNSVLNIDEDRELFNQCSYNVSPEIVDLSSELLFEQNLYKKNISCEPFVKLNDLNCTKQIFNKNSYVNCNNFSFILLKAFSGIKDSYDCGNDISCLESNIDYNKAEEVIYDDGKHFYERMFVTSDKNIYYWFYFYDPQFTLELKDNKINIIKQYRPFSLLCYLKEGYNPNFFLSDLYVEKLLVLGIFNCVSYDYLPTEIYNFALLDDYIVNVPDMTPKDKFLFIELNLWRLGYKVRYVTSYHGEPLTDKEYIKKYEGYGNFLFYKDLEGRNKVFFDQFYISAPKSNLCEYKADINIDTLEAYKNSIQNGNIYNCKYI